jgi:predicted HicB family RNase H-like nuclease
MEYVKFTLRLAPEMHEAFRRRAFVERVSINALLISALGKYLWDSKGAHGQPPVQGKE